MDYKRITSLRVHPGIGVSRIGSGIGYFYSPETLEPAQPRPDGYKDRHGDINRQAQRFRVYAYDVDGAVIGEVTEADARITWSVHLANKKAAWYNFDIALDLDEGKNTKSTRRNPDFHGAARDALAIDAGMHTIAGANASSGPLAGWFIRPNYPVVLGELKTDEEGRLIVLGGKGVSGTPIANNPVSTFANNSGWHDDTSDGPVKATVTLPDGRELDADPAWVVVAPPNYAPDIVGSQSMYDLMFDTLAGDYAKSVTRPSFTEHILPILHGLSETEWVNAGFLALFGWRSSSEFMRPELLEKLSSPSRLYKPLRRQILHLIRDPSAKDQQAWQWPPLYGDAYGDATSPRAFLAITKTRYRYLKLWVDGKFVADWKQTPAPVPEPAILDRAALEFCLGGPFHPGCEMTWPMRQESMYRDMFRLRLATGGPVDYGDVLTQDIVLTVPGPLSGSGPGDITKWMAVPWQTDTASCLSGYAAEVDPNIPSFWPARVPNEVILEDDYQLISDPAVSDARKVRAFYRRSKWLRSLGLHAPYLQQLEKMLKVFGKLGVVERREGDHGPNLPRVMYVEIGAATPIPPGAPTSQETPAKAEYRNRRFGGRTRKVLQ